MAFIVPCFQRKAKWLSSLYRLHGVPLLREQDNTTDNRQQENGNDVNSQEPTADFFPSIKKGKELLSGRVVRGVGGLRHKLFLLIRVKA